MSHVNALSRAPVDETKHHGEIVEYLEILAVEFESNEIKDIQ